VAKRSIEQKARKRVARLIRKEQNALPVFIDPVAWLINNGHAKTKREARQIIVSDRLTDGENPVGQAYVFEGERLVRVAGDRVPVELKDKLQVVDE